MPSKNEPSESETPTPEDQEWDGTDRRREGQPVLTRRPVVVGLEILSGLTGIAAIIALVFALLNFSQRLDTIQAARQASAFDSCRLLNVIINSSGTTTSRVIVYDPSGHVLGFAQFGGRDQQKRTQTFINQIGLADCHQYAVRVRRGQPALPGLSRVLAHGHPAGH